MDQTFIITTTATIFLALVGYFAKYLHNLHLSRRKDRLERINKQLSELYGPMFSLTHASTTAWKVGNRWITTPSSLGGDTSPYCSS